jgi:hypothetical protein
VRHEKPTSALISISIPISSADLFFFIHKCMPLCSSYNKGSSKRTDLSVGGKIKFLLRKLAAREDEIAVMMIPLRVGAAPFSLFPSHD